ncbi:MAG TPA: acyl carrier protein [Ruminococcaceae bacterium]|nr:acyl carrier protein [Oscillospiraceae bacterium]
MEESEIIVFIKNEIALMLECKPGDIDEDANFLKLGLTSVQALKVINRMRKALNVNISPVALFEYKTISEFAEYLSNSEQEDEDDE